MDLLRVCSLWLALPAAGFPAAFAADAPDPGHRPAPSSLTLAPLHLEITPVIRTRRTFDRRWALNTAVTAGAVVFGTLAVVEFGAAQRAFGEYKAQPDDDTALFIYDTYVVPNRTGFVIASIATLALAGVGVGLWVTTDLTVGATWRW